MAALRSFSNFCVGLLDQVVHVCYTYDETFKINLECCLKLDYTIFHFLVLKPAACEHMQNQSNEKRLSFYCVWKTWRCPAPPASTTLQLYLAASNFDCPTFFSHQVGVNTSHRSKKLSTSTASATCHSRFVNNAIFPSIYNVLSISSIMQPEVCHWIQVCNYFLLPPLYQHKIANID